MAKALLGHVGGLDPRLVTEVQRLRRRVTDLEAEVGRLKQENDGLAQAAVEHASLDSKLSGDLVLDDTTVREPAFT
jgi:hypothetical protein